MAITSAATRKAGPYTCNGVTVAFPFNFKIFTAADLVVTQTSAGVESILTSGFNVTLNANQDANPGGTLTMAAAPVAGLLITLTSQVAYTQPMVLTNNGGFFATVLNDMADRCVMLVQQMLEKLNRAVTLPISTAANVNPQLPPPIANRGVKWDATGLAFTTTLYDPDTASTQAASSAAASLASQNAAAVSEAAALAHLNEFKGRYYGPLASDPTVDPLGSVCGTGDVYFNSTTGYMRAFNGSAWVDYNAASAASAVTATTQAGVSTTQAGISTAQAVIATTQAGISTTQAVLSDAARVQAQAARDAANVNARIYATTAAGLAATTTGQYFSVPSALSTEHLILYLNSAGVAVEQKRYSSSSGMESLVIGATSRTSVDIVPTLVWTANMLLWNDGHIGAISGYYSTDLIAVVPGQILKYIGGVNHSSQNITIAGYNGSSVFVSAIYSGAVPVNASTGSQSDNAQYITIPAGILFIRFGQQLTTALTVAAFIDSGTQYNEQNLAARIDKPSNQLVFGRFYPQTAGVIATANSSSIMGTGYVPVAVGDTLVWALNSVSSVYGVALYTSAKVFIRFLELNTAVPSNEVRYTLNAVDDATAAYAVAGSYSTIPATLAACYFYATKTNSLSRTIYEVTNAVGLGKGFRRSIPNFLNYVPSSLTVTDMGTYKRVTVLANPNYLLASPGATLDPAFPNAFYAIKIRLAALPGASVNFSFYNASWAALGQNSGITNMTAVGQTSTVWTASNGLHHLMCDTVGAQYDVLTSYCIEFSAAFAATMKSYDWARIGNDARFLESRFSVSDLATRALYAETLKTSWWGKKVAVFGNSTIYTLFTSGDYLFPYFNLTVTDCTTGGSSFSQNLTDAKLALIPVDVALVFITSGCAGIDPLANDITSRVRTTLEGAVNYAIDWIYANRPTARVLLGNTDYASNGGGYDVLASTINALATYRKVPCVDTWRDADINASNYAITGLGDGIHLSVAGMLRKAGVIAGKLRSLSI